jgi:hypothetical protein
MGFKSKVSKYRKKYEVYSYYSDRTFDFRDKKRIKPFSRLRRNETEIELENKCDIKLRVKDWYCDIDTEFYK